MVEDLRVCYPRVGAFPLLGLILEESVDDAYVATVRVSLSSPLLYISVVYLELCRQHHEDPW